jgi:hypothetical protein
MKEKRIQLNTIVKNQLPQYVKEEYPLIGEFLSQYYLSQEFQGAPIDLIQNIDNYTKVDSITNLSDYTILGSDLSEIDTEINVSLLDSENGSVGFPEKYGLLLIDNELILYESKEFGKFVNCYRGFSGIVSYTNTNVGIASTSKIKSSDQLIFKDSSAEYHTSGTKVYNLSSLFLKEFLTKTKSQLTPGFENRSFVEKLNESILIKQIKDFYESKGTDRSFEILFQALYGEKVEVIKPKDYLFRPSDAKYKVTNDLVVEEISGDIKNAVNLTLYQDEYLNIPKAYAPITDVETVLSDDGNIFYKLKIDGGYNRDLIYDGTTYGQFSVHPKTRNIGKVLSGADYIDVDSTVGFPNSGDLYLIYDDQSIGIVSYKSKNLTQFLECSNITSDILDNTQISINTFAYATDQNGENITVRINSILEKIELPEDSHYYSKGDTAIIKTLGVIEDNAILNDWVFNTAVTYDVKSFNLLDVSDQTYSLEFENNHLFRVGDSIQLINSSGEIKNSTIIDILSEKIIVVIGQGFISQDNYKVKRYILKVNSNNFSLCNNLSSNIQNIYKDKNEDKILVSSPSIPSYPNQSLEVTNRSVTFSGSFVGDTFKITTINDHGFYTGDCVYYYPQTTIQTTTDIDGNSESIEIISSFLFDEGVYFIKRVDSNNIKFSKSISNILEEKYITLDTETIVTDNKIEPYEFTGKELQSQKLMREISSPITVSEKTDTAPGYTGILVNGVEILNYKSKDKVIYGPIEDVEVVANGSNYDIINPPNLIIEDNIGSGATCYCGVSGSLQEIRIVDRGFDYLETPIINITGGNGSGAKALPNMKLVTHEVSFNSEITSKLVSLGSTSSTINFTSNHKFRNGEKVIYKTYSQKNISGLTTDSIYFVSTISPTSIKLHKTFEDSIAGTNNIVLSGYGNGTHSFNSVDKKLVLSSVSVVSSGSGYENKKRTVSFDGIDIFDDTITINNHGFKSGEVVKYSTSGTVLGGLTNNTNYYVTTNTKNSFRLSEVGSGNYSPDFYYKTKQFVDITSKNNDIHVFNYPDINVEIIGNVGIDSSYKAQIYPVFRGEISSVHLISKGSSYGVENVFNLDRQPLFDIISGYGSEFKPIISNGQIKEVLVNNVGQNYTAAPDLIISGSGTGAVLVPIVTNNTISSVKVIEGGSGYSQESTEIVAVQPGEGAKFKAKIKNWTVNLFQKYSNYISKDDGFISLGVNKKYGLQYCHLYAPRKLRELLYSKDQSGKILFSNPDLKKANGVEINSGNHSPIIGWSYDGNPIYGPYGYSKKSGGVVSQMKSGYVLNLDANRPSLNYFAEGFFVEDYKYVYSEDDTVLDENNGRFCITPEFPSGTYAYFATINYTSVESSGSFLGYKKPQFPYLIGNYYNSKPNEFNFKRSSNQDDIDLNNGSWIRNTYSYNLTNDKSTYEYVSLPNKLKQSIKVASTLPGTIDNIGISSSGDNYKVNDQLVFNNFDSDGKSRGNSLSAYISKIQGKEIANISVATTSLYEVEIYPSKTKNEYVVYSTSPHNLDNLDLINISGLTTTSSLLEGSYKIKVNQNKLSLYGVGSTTIGISSVSVTGIVTYVSVRGNLNYPNIRENDILLLDDEKIKVLNIDEKSSRLRILRQIDDTVGTHHTVSTILYEIPRKFRINSDSYSYDKNIKENREIYFNPSESLGIGTNPAIGIGTIVNISNPGVGVSQIFIQNRSVYLPNHNLNTGDIVTYETNGGSSIQVSSTGIGSTALTNNSYFYIARLNDNFIGLSTVQVGLGSTGFFTGISSTTKNIGLLYFVGFGTGTYHSFITNNDSLKGRVTKNTVTVSLNKDHELLNGDEVNIEVNPTLSSSIILKYNDYSRRILINPKEFDAADVDIDTNSIYIEDHGLLSGQKIIHTSDSPCGGLYNNQIYYVIFVDKDNIKLSDSYFNSTKLIPEVIDIVSSSYGSISLINPPIKVYKDSKVIFDLSDASLAYSYQSILYSAFDFVLYTDSNFKNIFNSSSNTRVFNVKKLGNIGISTDARVELTVDSTLPNNLYYNLVPIYNQGIPQSKTEIICDDLVQSYNQIQVLNSIYNGTYKISNKTDNSFQYFIKEIPESLIYSQTSSNLKYYTNSLNAKGSISKIKIQNKGLNYYSLPTISNIKTEYGEGAILECFSSNIGKIKKTKIEDVGFDFPSDHTLLPNISLSKIVKIDRLSSFEYIGITSFGRGYLSAPKLLVFDGKTKEFIPEVDLKYNIGDSFVTIKNNTYGISNTTPIILPFENSNGVGISNISYNSVTQKVAVTLSVGFSTLTSFPFQVNDKVLIENVSVGVGSTGKGFNSEDYNYQLFTITDIEPNIGGIGSVYYSLSEYLMQSEVPGSFDSANSSGRIIPEKFFPIFSPKLKTNEYVVGEKVLSGNSSGIVEKWDSISNYLTISSKDTFYVGEKIKGLVSKSQGIASSITDFNCYAKLNPISKYESGWQTNAGFLNDNLQKIQDSFYYQNFSYSLKSKIDYDTWSDAVSALNHTVGFKKFADLQMESLLSEENKGSLKVGISTNVTNVESIVNMIGYADLNCVSDFDFARENSIKISSRVFSDRIYFKNRILTDYFESFGNRVLKIDDISDQFNSNPRPTKYVEVHRFNSDEIRSQKYFTYIKDRRYTSQRQSMLISLIHDGSSGYIDQYGRVETVYDQGSFDFNIIGSEGVLLFYPTRYSINDYQVAVLSYNLQDNFSGIGTISFDSSTLLSVNSATFSPSSTNTVVSFATTYRSAKVLVQINGGDGEYEFNELNIIHNGTDVELLEFGQLSTKSTLSESSVGYGTFYPYISGSNVNIDFISYAGIGTTNYFNSFVFNISDETNNSSDIIEMKHARLESRATSIASTTSPSPTTILDYSGEYSAAHCLVQISDLTNSRYQMSEIIMIGDDFLDEVYLTEFANIETGGTSLGSISGSMSGDTTQLTFTPLSGISCQVKVYATVLRLQDDFKDTLDLNSGTIETNYALYTGTDREIKKEFYLTHKNFPIFEKYFSGFSTSIVDLQNDTIEIPGHFFVTGEKINYTYAGAGTTQSIGIASTSITGIGLTNKLPSDLYVVKVNDNKIKLSATAEDALKSIPKTLNLTSAGIGTNHRFVGTNQNAKVIISIDNIIQSPIVATSQTSQLSVNAFTTDDILYFTGIGSFYGGDLIKIGNEIMKIESVGIGSTNSVNVRRPWLGTNVAGYSTGSLVTKVTGNYNIVDNILNFVEAPYGKIPLSASTNPPDERDWEGITVSSRFQGRSFMRSGIPNGTNDAYYKNYIFDDISSNFNGTNNTFRLTSSKSNISGIYNENAIILVNGVFQGPGVSYNYNLSETSGITSITFTGAGTSVAYDVNSSSLPTGGIIVSVGSSEGFGYQPLVSAGGTAVVSISGTISSISIGNSGSGYRSGIQNIRVGIQTYDSNDFYIEYIGIASAIGGHIVGVAITNPGIGYTSSNPPKVIFDDPLSYSDIPLVYSSSSVSGFGTAATIDVVVGQGSSIIEFEIKNTGYGYAQNEILTVPILGSIGIPTTSSFNESNEFRLSIQSVISDTFSGWSLGELQVFDDISELFDGETTTFPLTISGNLYSIKAAKGSNINVEDLLLVFVNDILQIPGEGYIFDGGSAITFTEAPKGIVDGIPETNDKCKIIFYKGSGSVDVVDRNILETVKIGDEITLNYDSLLGQSSSLQEEDRTVTSLLSSDAIKTNPYFGPGNTEDESLYRTLTWCRQTEDKIIDEQEISKDRMLYEPIINPVSYLIKSVGIGSTIIFVDNVRPFFNQINESDISLDFQKQVTFISQESKVAASATAVVSIAGTISSIQISNGGFGYLSNPSVTVESPVGLGTTLRASATSYISSGIVTSITVVYPGVGYTHTNPPQVLIEPPQILSAETNTVSSYSGDFGIISGVSTTSVGVASTGIVFDLVIERDSFLRNSAITGVTTISGIQTGYYFAVYNTNIGNSVTSLDENRAIIGIGTTFLDNIYRVASVSIAQTSCPGLGVTYVAKVTVSVANYNSLTGLGSSSFYGNYSWGKIDLSSRSKEISYNSYNQSGYVGISTGTIVRRTKPLKYINYVP